MTIYFTSDLHFGHANAIEFTNRPFSSVEEMNARLLENINNTVLPQDELYILGDFSFRIPKVDAVSIANKIRCRKVTLIKGNHDKNYEGETCFREVCDYKELKLPFGKAVLFHYPIASWNAKHHGSLHLHGHIHSTGDYNGRTDEFGNPIRIWDVGVDANGYKPVSLDEILFLLEIPAIGSKENAWLRTRHF